MWRPTSVTSRKQVTLLTPTKVPMQTLTERMGEDMRLRGFAPKTQQSYRGAVAILAKFHQRSPDSLDTLTEAE